MMMMMMVVGIDFGSWYIDDADADADDGRRDVSRS